MLKEFSKMLFTRALGLCGKLRSLSYDPARTIVISGRPRSGTTWLAEILNRITKYPLVVEPLMLTKLSKDLIHELDLHWRTYRNSDSQDPRFYRFIQSLLTGAFIQPNFLPPAQYNLPFLLNFSTNKPIIVKFCRANLFLPYLHKNFPKNKIILIIRDPYATAASQILHGNWDQVKEFSPHQPEFYNDYPEFVLQPPLKILKKY